MSAEPSPAGAIAGASTGPYARAICQAASPVARSTPYTAVGPTVTARSPCRTGAETPKRPVRPGSKRHAWRYGGATPSGTEPGWSGPPWNWGHEAADCAHAGADDS